MERHSNVYNILRTSRISDLPLESRCCRGSWTDCVLLPGLQVLTGTLASALGFPVKVLVNLRTPGSKQGEGGLPYKCQGCHKAAPSRQRSFPCPAPQSES